MRRIAGGVLIAVGLLLSVSLCWAQEQTWITIATSGKERGAFVPRHQPYTQGGPAVSVYLFDQKDVRTPAGEALTGFDFIGWIEGNATRVQVFALVPNDGAPNTFMPGGDSRNLIRRDFASYLLEAGQSQPIIEMRTLGIEPMVIRSVNRSPSPR